MGYRTCLVLLLAECLAGTSFIPPAQAVYDPVNSGTVRLRFDQSFLRFLRDNNISVEPAGPARFLRSQELILPVQGGVVDPTLGRGTVETEGAFAFARGHRRVPFRKVEVKAKPVPLVARVGGGQLKVASTPGVEMRRTGFGTRIATRQLLLTAKVATRLTKKLRPPQSFQAGQAIGSIETKQYPSTTSVLPQGKVSVTLEPSFVDKMNGLFVAINPVFPAEHSGLQFSFPVIPGGDLSPAGVEGTLKMGGSIEFLQLGSNNQITWHEPWLEVAAAALVVDQDAEPSPPLSGKAGPTPAFAFSLTAISANAAARTISLGGSLKLQGSTAQLLNQAFAEPEGKSGIFSSGEPFASVNLTAAGQ